MRRLAPLLAAAAVLGTGCIGQHRCDPTLTVDWSFVDADGGTTSSCATAGVSQIDVFSNGTWVGSFDCFGPPGTVQLASGQNDLIVEGTDANGQVLYRDLRTVTASSCASQGTLQARPAEGWLAVDYSFTPTNVCFATQPTYVWIAVRDDLIPDPQPNVTKDTGTGAAQLCDVTGAAPRYRLPVGSFTFLGVEEVRPGVGVVGANCQDAPFDIAPALVTTITPALADSTAACF